MVRFLAFSLFVVGCSGNSEAPPAVDMAIPDLRQRESGQLPPLCQPDQIGDAGVPATFANVQFIFDNTCSMGMCHFAGFQVPGGIGLDLSHGRAYMNIVNQMAPDKPNQCGGNIVTPGHPEQSYLLVKLTSGLGMQCNKNGGLMPVGEPFSTPLDDCLIDLVRRWILAGAPP